MASNCSGNQLPRQIQSIQCSDPVTHFDNCCKPVEITAEILLYEHILSDREGYYWISLIADDTPIVVCALEQYANQQKHWPGRRADYLALGWYNGDCYLVLIELRNALVTVERFEDKLDQVEQSINLVVSEVLPQFAVSDLFKSACNPSNVHKIVGVIIPVMYSKKRAEQTRYVNVGDYQAVIVALPNSCIIDCKIGWYDLLRATGL